MFGSFKHNTYTRQLQQTHVLSRDHLITGHRYFHITAQYCMGKIGLSQKKLKHKSKSTLNNECTLKLQNQFGIYAKTAINWNPAQPRNGNQFDAIKTAKKKMFPLIKSRNLQRTENEINLTLTLLRNKNLC